MLQPLEKGKRPLDGIRKRKKEGEEEEGVLKMKSQKDPLVVLGLDIMYMILSNLDACGVVLCLLVSRRWHGVACSDRLWASKCEELWRGKAHIPRIARLPGLPEIAAYSLSVMDSNRKRITRDDLCDHVWEFHFNEAAPEYWRKLDPYWEGTGDPMCRYFHQDGSHTAGLGDKVWGGHEASYSVVTGLNANGNIREHYVRINRWAPLYISRKSDWRWVMSNGLVCYSSIPDTDKEDGTGPLSTAF